MQEFLLVASPLSAALILVCSGLAILGFGALATSIFGRSLPGRVIRTADLAEHNAADALKRMTDLRAEWSSTLEQLEHYLEQVERKRRSLQGAESRMRSHLEKEAAQAAASQAEDPSDRLARLRREVYGQQGTNKHA